jgi:hypothetical protein
MSDIISPNVDDEIKKPDALLVDIADMIIYIHTSDGMDHQTYKIDCIRNSTIMITSAEMTEISLKYKRCKTEFDVMWMGTRK